MNIILTIGLIVICLAAHFFMMRKMGHCGGHGKVKDTKEKKKMSGECCQGADDNEH